MHFASFVTTILSLHAAGASAVGLQKSRASSLQIRELQLSEEQEAEGQKEMECIQAQFDQLKCEELRGEQAKFSECMARAIAKCPVKILTIVAKEENQSVCQYVIEAEKDAQELKKSLEDLSDSMGKLTESLLGMLTMLANELEVSDCELAGAIEKADKH